MVAAAARTAAAAAASASAASTMTAIAVLRLVTVRAGTIILTDDSRFTYVVRYFFYCHVSYLLMNPAM